LAGGTGTVPFLVGIGYFVDEDFQIDQYFMRDYHEETALIKAVKERFENCQVLISYNGKCYDVNILSARFTLSRMEDPLIDTPHLDLLFPVRRLWRRRIGDCSLTNVERTILGFERQNDVPGFLIPSLYFEYLRTRSGRSLESVFQHNRWDIMALAVLTGLTGQIHQAPLEQLDHPIDFYSLGRSFESMSELEQAVVCFKEAVQYLDSPEDREVIFTALGRSLKRLERWDEALAVWQKMIQQSTRLISPYEEISKYFEHRTKDFQQAFEIVNQALEKVQRIETLYPESHYAIDRQDLEYRLARLIRKLEKNKE
jgi:tetratricopeptide (TPR) repeat protein